MNEATARIIANETSRFYNIQALSFSKTRESPWKGWERIVEIAQPAILDIDVLDIACGNMRFERYLESELAPLGVRTYAFDNCRTLAEREASNPRTQFFEADIINLLERDGLLEYLERRSPKCNLCVSFGFMHHVPLKAWRKRLLSAMIAMTRPMGYVCISFWQFGKDERLMAKARKATPAACERLKIRLSEEDGDYFMDWMGDESTYRYAHDFSDQEISEMVEFANGHGACLFKTYLADGRNNDLNRYIVLKRDID